MTTARPRTPATRSLRFRLFLLIVAPLVVVAAMGAASRYVLAERLSQTVYDNTLLTVALTVSRDVLLTEGDLLAEDLLDTLAGALGDPIYYSFSGPDGRFVTGYSDPPDPPAGIVPTSGIPAFFDSVVQGQPVRVVVLREFYADERDSGWITVQVWQTITERQDLSRTLLLQSLALMAALIVTAALAVWFGIDLGLRPLQRLNDAIAKRSPDDLSPIRRAVPREARTLVVSMNALFRRLSEAFDLRKRFLADAAHQLRNPVAAILAQAEAAMTAPTEVELRARVLDLTETARRTGRLTQQLLSLNKVEGRSLEERRTACDVAGLVGRIARRHYEHAVRDDIDISLQLIGEPRLISADQVMLEEAIDNLIDNALRHGCTQDGTPGGEVRLTLSYGPDTVELQVADDGPGVPQALRDKVFERFFRVSDAAPDGCGLGLAIAREVAETHGGSLDLGAPAPDAAGTGAVFRLVLPG